MDSLMTHCTTVPAVHQLLYLNLLPEELVAVVEALEVLKLPQELYRGLRAVRVQLRHVQIVHEHHHVLISRST